MGGNANPGARQRAWAELRRDPARSNYVIAAIARCTPQHAGCVRRDLEAAGVIAHVPPARRAQRPRLTPFRSRARTAIEAGAQLPEQVAAFGLSRAASYAALARARARADQAGPDRQPSPGSHRQLPDAAAAADTIVTNGTIRPRPGVTLGDHPPPGYYAPPDEIEGWCCVREWSGGQFAHERSCLARSL